MIPTSGPVASRLGKLAETGRTGALCLTGESGGVIYLREGAVVAAESRRTPGLAARIGQAAMATGHRTVGPFERSWIATEATIDAAMELMSAKPRHLRFRGPEEEPVPAGTGMPVPKLMTEVSRRHEILQQLAAELSPDTQVARNLRLQSRAVRVSDGQWAILLQLGRPASPRGLALELGQSVFGTTMEVYRMTVMGLLSPADAPDRPAGADRRPALSFIRATAGSG